MFFDMQTRYMSAYEKDPFVRVTYGQVQQPMRSRNANVARGWKKASCLQKNIKFIVYRVRENVSLPNNVDFIFPIIFMLNGRS